LFTKNGLPRAASIGDFTAPPKLNGPAAEPLNVAAGLATFPTLDATPLAGNIVIFVESTV